MIIRTESVLGGIVFISPSRVAPQHKNNAKISPRLRKTEKITLQPGIKNQRGGKILLQYLLQWLCSLEKNIQKKKVHRVWEVAEKT